MRPSRRSHLVTVPRLSLLSWQCCHLGVEKWTPCAARGRAGGDSDSPPCVHAPHCVHAGSNDMADVMGSFEFFEETTPRKTAENTAMAALVRW